MAQAVFFHTTIEIFKEVACGFVGDHPYFQSVDQDGKPLGFFGPLDQIHIGAEESGRAAQHAHGLLGSRFFKLHNITEVMNTGSQYMLAWMGSVATCVMGSRIVDLQENGDPMITVPSTYLDGFLPDVQPKHIAKRKRKLLLSTLLPQVEDLPENEQEDAMEDHVACLKHALLLHRHSTRYVSVLATYPPTFRSAHLPTNLFAYALPIYSSH